MITEDYVSFEVAKLLKKKGFDEVSVMYYPKDGGEMAELDLYDLNYNRSKYIKCPTQAMAMKWLREVHHIIIVPHPLSFNVAKDCLCENWVYSLWVGNKLEVHESLGNQTNYPIYEEAAEAAILYCLQNLI